MKNLVGVRLNGFLYVKFYFLQFTVFVKIKTKFLSFVKMAFKKSPGNDSNVSFSFLFKNKKNTVYFYFYCKHF